MLLKVRVVIATTKVLAYFALLQYATWLTLEGQEAKGSNDNQARNESKVSFSQAYPTITWPMWQLFRPYADSPLHGLFKRFVIDEKDKVHTRNSQRKARWTQPGPFKSGLSSKTGVFSEGEKWCFDFFHNFLEGGKNNDTCFYPKPRAPLLHREIYFFVRM